MQRSNAAVVWAGVMALLFTSCAPNPDGSGRMMLTLGREEEYRIAANQREWSKAGFQPGDESLCSSRGILLQPAIAWGKAGFHSCAEVDVWRQKGIDDPGVAAAWEAIGSSATTALTLRAVGMTTAEVKAYGQAGLRLDDPDQVLRARILTGHGFSVDRAAFYVRHNVAYDDIPAFDRARAEYQRNKLATEQRCGSKMEPFEKLLMASPYATEGRCYQIPGMTVSQWLGPTSAFVYQNTMVVDFGSIPDVAAFSEAVALGEGAYVYQSVSAGMRTVPRVRILMTLHKGMEEPVPQ